MSPFNGSDGPSDEAVRTVLENFERQQRQQPQPPPGTEGGNWFETALDGLELAVDATDLLEGVGDALGSVAEVAGEAIVGLAGGLLG